MEKRIKCICKFMFGADLRRIPYTGTDGKGLTVFIVEGEILNTLNKNIFNAKPIDKIVKLPKQKGSSFYNHSMEAVKKALDEAHYK